MNPEITSTLPSDLEIEYALIGWVLADNSLLSKLTQITAEDFYSTQHRDVWKAMNQLYALHMPISPFTVNPHLPKPEIFLENGGALKYLAMATNQTLLYPAPEEQEKYLVKLAQQRTLSLACQDIGSLTPIEAASKLNRVAERIMNARPTDDFENNYQVTSKIIEALKDNRQPYSTGYKKLNEAMGGGIYPGRSYGFAARKKMGKTILAGSLSHNLNMDGIKHLFICGEMSPEEIQQRTLARSMEVFPSAFRSDYGKSRDFANKLARVATETPQNVLFKNAPGLTFDELKAIYATAIDRHQIKGVILDYWQLVGGKLKHQSTAEHLDEVAQWIADYSRKRGIWTVMMAQINQDGNTRGGEGIRLAFDQVYNLKAPEDDPSRSGRSLEMMETRYTGWLNVGKDGLNGLTMNEKGPFFEEI